MNDGDDMPALARDRWTPIAFRPRLVSSPVTFSWISIDGAPLDAAAANG